MESVVEMSIIIKLLDSNAIAMAVAVFQTTIQLRNFHNLLDFSTKLDGLVQENSYSIDKSILKMKSFL